MFNIGSISPKGKISKSKRNMKRAQAWKISIPSLVVCGKCGERARSHRVCRSCGTYNKKEILAVNE